jgi:hypothetical protein
VNRTTRLAIEKVWRAASRSLRSREDREDVAQVTRELAQVVAEGMTEAPLDRDTLELLQIGRPHLLQRACSDEAVVTGQTAARLGYLARAAGSAMFGADQPPDPDLLATLGASSTRRRRPERRRAMRWLATGESLDPPPDEGSVMDAPGLGGEARGRLRDDLVGRLPCPPDISGDDLKRTWEYGYLLCALDELTEA